MSSRIAGELASPVTPHMRTLLKSAPSSAAPMMARRTKLVTPHNTVARWRSTMRTASSRERCTPKSPCGAPVSAPTTAAPDA